MQTIHVVEYMCVMFYRWANCPGDNYNVVNWGWDYPAEVKHLFSDAKRDMRRKNYRGYLAIAYPSYSLLPLSDFLRKYREDYVIEDLFDFPVIGASDKDNRIPGLAYKPSYKNWEIICRGWDKVEYPYAKLVRSGVDKPVLFNSPDKAKEYARKLPAPHCPYRVERVINMPA